MLNDNRNTFTEIEKDQLVVFLDFCDGGWKLDIVFVTGVLLSSKELLCSKIGNEWNFVQILPLLLLLNTTFSYCVLFNR